MAILIVVLLWMVICESSMLAEVATDKAQLPYISRWMICFMGWLSECIVCFTLALFFSWRVLLIERDYVYYVEFVLVRKGERIRG